MQNYFIYDGLDSRDYGIWIFDMTTDTGAELQQEKISVPGRDGDLTIGSSRLANVTHRYMGVIYQNFESNLQAFRDAMAAKRGYLELTDSLHPGEVYRALYSMVFDPTIPRGRSMGKFAIEFDRKPQRWLASGQSASSVASGDTLTNPTSQKARPLIHVVGYGTLYVGSHAVTISQGYAYVDIDCDMMDCYHGTDNANELVTFGDGEFPVLEPGENGITYSGNITSVSITPRYWRV